MNNMSTLFLKLSPREVRQALDDYFKTTTFAITELQQLGSRIFLSIYYEDFKPASEVRDDIEGLGDNITVSAIHRTFSPAALLDALDDEQLPDGELFVKLADGTYAPTCIMWVLEERLRNRDLIW